MNEKQLIESLLGLEIMDEYKVEIKDDRTIDINVVAKRSICTIINNTSIVKSGTEEF